MVGTRSSCGTARASSALVVGCSTHTRRGKRLIAWISVASQPNWAVAVPSGYGDAVFAVVDITCGSDAGAVAFGP